MQRHLIKFIGANLLFRIGRSRASYSIAMVFLAGLWLLSFDLFELIKVLYAEQTCLQEILAYVLPLLFLCVLAVLLWARYSALGMGSRKWITLYGIAAILILLNKINLAMRLVDSLTLDYLYALQFVLGMLPVAIIASLIAVSLKTKGRESVTQIKKSILVFVCIPFALSQVLGLSDGIHYRTQNNIVEFAHRGSPERSLLVANNFLTGVGVKRSVPLSVKWYRIAAKKGSPDALYYMGRIYSAAGKKQISFDLYSAAAKQGVEYAQYEIAPQEYDVNLYNSLERHRNTTVCNIRNDAFDAIKCRDWALTGSAYAQYQYAKYLEGFYKDLGSFPLSNILFWYERAADSGNIKSQRHLISLYVHGMYGPRNFLAAERLCENLTDLGYVWYYPKCAVLKIILKGKEV